MPRFIPRPISTNYIRNGGFEKGDITHWHPPTGFYSYSIADDSNFGSGKCLYGLTSGGLINIEQDDYTLVQPGEILDLSLVVKTVGAGYCYFWVKWYSPTLQYLGYKLQTVTALTGDYEPLQTKVRVPDGVGYVKIMYDVNTGGSGYNKIGSITMRITPNNDSVNKLIHVETVVLQSNDTINVGNYHDLVLTPGNDTAVYRILNLYMYNYKEATASTGSYGTDVLIYNQYQKVASLHYAYNQDFIYEYTEPAGTPSVMKPSDPVLFDKALKDLRITKDRPLIFRTYNNTDVPYTKYRHFHVNIAVESQDGIYLDL